MRIEIHAKRFADEPNEREQVFNSQPASIPVEKGEEVIIHAKDGIVRFSINGYEQMPISLAEFDYTAFAMVYGE